MNVKFNVTKEPNNTYKVDVTVDKDSVNKYLDEALKHEAENFQMKGFRKGAVPMNIVKEHLEPSKVRSHALNHMIPEVYKQLLNENKFNPIIGPRIELKEYEENKDLLMTITVVEKPEITIGDYKKALKELEGDEISSQEAINKVLEISDVKLAEIIVQEEVARMMSSLIDQTTKLGITIEQYVEAHNKNLQQIRDEFKANAEKTIKADFLISELALKEDLTVTDKDVEDTINVIPDAEAKKQFENPEQRMYIKAVMLKAKTLEKLVSIANEGRVKKEKPSEKPADEVKSDNDKSDGVSKN